jgi:hypothetical protein
MDRSTVNIKNKTRPDAKSSARKFRRRGCGHFAGRRDGGVSTFPKAFAVEQTPADEGAMGFKACQPRVRLSLT